jgi:hypothetical protein
MQGTQFMNGSVLLAVSTEGNWGNPTTIVYKNPATREIFAMSGTVSTNKTEGRELMTIDSEGKHGDMFLGDLKGVSVPIKKILHPVGGQPSSWTIRVADLSEHGAADDSVSLSIESTASSVA